MKYNRLLLSLFTLTLWVSFTATSAFAQNFATYKGRKVVANSIIVKYDKNASVMYKGTTVTAASKAAEIKSSYKVNVEKTFNKGKIEVWNFKGDIDAILAAARSIPGAIAAPNYVRELPKVERRNVSESELAAAVHSRRNSSSDFKIKGAKYSAQTRTGGSAFDLNKVKSKVNPSLLKKAKVSPSISQDVGYTILENFEDAVAVDSTWTIDFDEVGSVWYLAQDSTNNYMLVGDLENGYLPNSFTKANSPIYDFSDLSAELDYRLEFTFTSAIELGYDFFWVNAYVIDEENDETFVIASNDYSQNDSLTYYASLQLPNVAGLNQVYFEFGFLSDETGEVGFGVAFDDLILYASEKEVANDPFVGLQYALNNTGTHRGFSVEDADIDGFEAWQYSEGSRDVNVVVFDTGSDIYHPDLNENLWRNPGEIENNGVDDDGNGYVDDYYGWDAIYNDGFPEDGDGHGSHVAGIIGAVGDNNVGITGINKRVSIITVRIFDENGFTNDAAIMGGYEYISTLLEQGVDIVAINQSWGGGIDYNDEFTPETVEFFLDFATEHGVYNAIWVVSAGNSALDHDNLLFQRYPDPIQAPNILSVASTTAFDELSDFSDYGLHTVEVGSPGSDILSTVPGGYAFYSGTSMASPYVTGVLALSASVYGYESDASRIARILASTDKITSLEGKTITGGRLNAYNAVSGKDKSGPATISANPARGYFNRVDELVAFSVGMVNTTGEEIAVNGFEFVGDDAALFSTFEDDITDAVTVPAGGAFGVGVALERNRELEQYDFTTTLVFNTSAGAVEVPIVVATQSEPEIAVEKDELFKDLGEVNYGDVVETSLTFGNVGRGEMSFEAFQGLFLQDQVFESVNRLPVPAKVATNKAKRNFTDVVKSDMEKIAPLMALSGRKTIKLSDKSTFKKKGNSKITDESSWYFYDDLNDADAVASQWEIMDFGQGNLWTLHNLEPDTSVVIDNVFLAGDLVAGEGYANNTLTVAATPIFDFTELAVNGQMPYYLTFNYAAQLEEGYDFFYVNVLQFGERLATIAITERDLMNDGEYNEAIIDISQFAGMDGIEFWFIANYDDIYVGGFGSIFDNVGIVKGKAAFYVDQYSGKIQAGGTVTLNITANTDVIGTGDFVLFTGIETDAINDIQGYGTGYFEQAVVFNSTYNNFITVDPQFVDLGSMSRATPMVEQEVTVTNTGSVELEYFATSVIMPNFDDSLQMKAFYGESKVGKTNELAKKSVKAKSENKEVGKSWRQVVADLKGTLKRPAAVASKSTVSKKPYSSRISGKKAWIESKGTSLLEGQLVHFYENFDSSLEIPEGWMIQTLSENGYGWNIAPLDEGQNVLAFGDLDEGRYGNDTYSAVFSPLFDLSAVTDDKAPVLEFEYAAMVEQGWDFVSIFVGTLDDALAYPIASTEDILINDGYLNFASIDLSMFVGTEEPLFITILGTSDFIFDQGGAFIDEIALVDYDLLAYVSPRSGMLLPNEPVTMNSVINTGWLNPGKYSVFNMVQYSDGSNVQDFTFFKVDFETINHLPMAYDDTLAVMSGDMVDIEAMLAAMLENDTDEDGDWLYIEDVSDPVYGSFKRLEAGFGDFWWDGPTHYVAPLNYDGYDMVKYVVTDGFDYAVATAYIQVMAQPHFVTGVQQNFTFLEDHSLSLSTIKLAAGVGGMNESLHVWAMSHHEALHAHMGEGIHAMDFTADENFFGQADVTFYVSDDKDNYDSLLVTFVVVPVNDAPVALFEATVNNNVVSFTDLSADEFDPNGAVVSWLWDFGNGVTSTEQNPEITYEAIGQYEVTLVVTDNEGATAEYGANVDITEITAVENAQLPTAFEVFQNYPNPFNPSTQIKFAVPSAQKVTVEVFNVIGQKVATLANAQTYNAGFHSVAFDASRLSSGTYIYRVQAQDANGKVSVSSKSMILIK